jgi:hypothetical protein
MQTKNPGKSSDGIWYYVYLKPGWIMMYLEGGLHQHIHFWPHNVIPKLQEHYELTNAEAKKLEPLYASMPRGRVTSFKYGTSFEIVHGNDFPSCMGISSEINDILDLFNLPLNTPHGYHEHEAMLSGHKKRLQAVIGKVKY